MKDKCSTQNATTPFGNPFWLELELKLELYLSRSKARGREKRGRSGRGSCKEFISRIEHWWIIGVKNSLEFRGPNFVVKAGELQRASGQTLIWCVFCVLSYLTGWPYMPRGCFSAYHSAALTGWVWGNFIPFHDLTIIFGLVLFLFPLFALLSFQLILEGPFLQS